jgi:hypothetical protein
MLRWRDFDVMFYGYGSFDFTFVVIRVHHLAVGGARFGMSFLEKETDRSTIGRKNTMEMKL